MKPVTYNTAALACTFCNVGGPCYFAYMTRDEPWHIFQRVYRKALEAQ